MAPWWGLEGEWLAAPLDATGNFGETLLLAGVRGGPAVGPLAIHARLRAGTLRLGGPHHRVYDEGRARTEPAIDIGGVIELKTGRHVAIRIDGGRIVVPWGSVPIRGPLPPYSRVLGTRAHPYGSFGMQFRF